MGHPADAQAGPPRLRRASGAGSLVCLSGACTQCPTGTWCSAHVHHSPPHLCPNRTMHPANQELVCPTCLPARPPASHPIRCLQSSKRSKWRSGLALELSSQGPDVPLYLHGSCLLIP